MILFSGVDKILEPGDLRAIQSVGTSRDPRTLVSVLARILTKISSWELKPETITLTDRSGRLLFQLGEGVIMPHVVGTLAEVTLNVASTGVTSIATVTGSGKLRRISVRTTSAITGCTITLSSSTLAAALTLYSSGVFAGGAKVLATAISGTGAGSGDYMALDLDQDFRDITLSANVTVGGTGTLVIQAWYDRPAN